MDKLAFSYFFIKFVMLGEGPASPMQSPNKGRELKLIGEGNEMEFLYLVFKRRLVDCKLAMNRVSGLCNEIQKRCKRIEFCLILIDNWMFPSYECKH